MKPHRTNCFVCLPYLILVFTLLFYFSFISNDSSHSNQLFRPVDNSINDNNVIKDSFDQDAEINVELTLWSSDFHVSPIADIKAILPLTNYKVNIIDKSLSGHCRLTNTCQTDLKIINKYNGIDLGTCPNQLRERFYNTYKDDIEMKSVDIILCAHAASMCELFMPFNKTLIVLISTR